MWCPNVAVTEREGDVQFTRAGMFIIWAIERHYLLRCVQNLFVVYCLSHDLLLVCVLSYLA